jgi:hypothetical protein
MLKPTFWLKNDDEKRYKIFYFEILATSEIPANLPATLKVLVEFQNKKF